MGHQHDFSIVSLNVRGMINDVKRNAVFRWLKRHKFDIVYLQETHSTEELEVKWKNEWSGRSVMAHGNNRSRGCMVLFSDQLDVNVKCFKTDNEGRFVIINCDIYDQEFTLTNVYAPNTEGEQVRFITDIELVLLKMGFDASSKHIIGGDWNCIRNINLDKSGGCVNVKYKTIEKQDAFMNNFELNDIWRIKNPDQKRFTWRQKSPLIQCRLDFWLISDSIYDYVTDTDILPSVQSDHSAIVLRLKLFPSIRKGMGFWKFNCSLLNDELYTNAMHKKLTEWKITYDMTDHRIKWEIIKYEIRKFTIEYAKKRKKLQSDKEKELEYRLINMERQSINANNINEYENVKRELQEIEKEKINGLLIRSRIDWHEHGEKSTRYFFNLESSNAMKKHLRKLTLSDGTTTTDPDAILTEQMNFYKNLFSSKNENFDKSSIFLNNKYIPTLGEFDRNACEGLITIDECKNVLSTFKRNKSPGNDGLTIEYYEYFWNDVKQILVECLNYAYKHGELSTSQKQAIISLIHKKGKDRLLLKNWRPISLLNVDYKIATKVVAERIKKVLPFLIHSNQSGFVQDRYIGDTVRTVSDILDYTGVNNEPGILMMVDFEKAYDSLEWNFLFAALERYNFGKMLINWVKTFYCNTESCVTNNHVSSRYFKVSRGLRQGDPLSSYLFVLCVELLAIAIREDPQIKGIKVDSHELKLVQYADDTTAIVKDIDSVENVLKKLQLFASVSGLSVNKDKTEAMWIGSEKDNGTTPLQLKWTKGPLKVLGIFIGYDALEVEKANFEPRIQKVKMLLNLWKQRKLTLIGKILIVKTFALSQFVYLANLVPFSDDRVNEINELLFSYIWNGKPDKIKRNVIVKDLKSGGLKMPDLKLVITVQKMKWIRYALLNHDSFWLFTMKRLIGVEHLPFFLLSNCNTDDFSVSSMFYKEVLDVFKKCRHSDDSSYEGISSQLIFYNKNIKIGGQYFFSCKFVQVGLWRLCDFYEKGKLVPFEIWKARGLPVLLYYQWLSVVNAIKTIIKKCDIVKVHYKNCIMIKSQTNSVSFEELSSKQLYCLLLNNSCKLSKAQNKHSLYLDLRISFKQWERIYMLPHNTVKCNEVTEMQYKILHRYIATNRLLSLMKKVECSQCTFCFLQCETIYHLFYECVLLKSVWNHVAKSCSQMCSDDIRFSCKDIILEYENNAIDIDKVHIINMVILYTKYYIYKCKYEVVVPNIKGLKSYLQFQLCYETELDNILKHW